MKSRQIIEFPANPFVALSDFLMMLMIVIILAVLSQSVSNSRLMERMAISELQTKIRDFSEKGKTDKKGLMASAKALSVAYKEGIFKETYVDGDLQRFWFDGSKCFGTKSSELSSDKIKNIIIAFGYMLGYYQGDTGNPNTSLYKRIVVEGHSGENESDNPRDSWILSQNRALTIIDALQYSGVSPTKMEAAARGSWGFDTLPQTDIVKKSKPESISQRFDIIIIYSGNQALDYIKYKAEKADKSAIKR